jgi:hypothetical protein
MKQRRDLTRACRFALIFVCLAIGIDVPMCFNAPLVFHAGAQSNKDRSGSTSKSRALGKKPMVAKTVDPCAVVDANASLVLGPGVPGVQAMSDGGKYYTDWKNLQKGCGLYVVDITVPSDSSAPGFLPSFSIESGPVVLTYQGKDQSSGTNYAGGFALPNPVTACSAYHQETRIFVKPTYADEFNLIKQVKARGKETYPDFKSPKCELVPETDQGVLSYGLPFGFNPPKSGSKIYRVAISVALESWLGLFHQQVRVKASHDGDIK